MNKPVTDENDPMASEVIQAARTHQPTSLPVTVTIDHVGKVVEIWAQADLAPAMQRINAVTRDYAVKINSPPKRITT